MTDEIDFGTASEFAPYSGKGLDEKEKVTFGTEDDFGPPKKNYQLNKVNAMSGLNAMGLGYQFRGRQFLQALEQMGLAITDIFPGVDNKQKREDLNKIIENEKQIAKTIGESKFSKNKGWFNTGTTLAEILVGFALPTPQSKTMAMRALGNALIGGAFDTAMTPGGIGDRLAAGGMGAAGAGVGSIGVDALTKTIGGKIGKSLQPEAIARRDAARRVGLNPRLGDIADPNTLANQKSIENVLANSSIGSKAIDEDINALKRVIVPDQTTGANAINTAASNASKGVAARSQDIWSGFEQAIQGNVTSVRPKGLHEALVPLVNDYKQLFTPAIIPNETTREMLLAIANADPKKLPSIPIEQYHSLHKALGGIVANAKLMSTPATAGVPARLDKEAVGLVKDLYKQSSDDIRRWGNNGKNQKAFKLFENANEEWKRTILPWKENTIAKELSEGPKKFGMKDTVSSLIKADELEAAEFKRLMQEFGPYDSSDAIDGILSMKRQGAKFAGEIDQTGPLDVAKGITSIPGGMLSRNKTFQDAYLGDPMLDNTIAELTRRFGINYGRAHGDTASVLGAGLYDFLLGGEEDDRQSDDPAFAQGVGHATQMGVQGR